VMCVVSRDSSEGGRWMNMIYEAIAEAARLRAAQHEEDLGVCGGDLDVFIDVWRWRDWWPGWSQAIKKHSWP
jgi:hypothetical protein